MGLVRLATRPPLRQVGELLARLDAIEAKLGGPQGPGRERSDRGSRGAPPNAASRSRAEPVDRDAAPRAEARPEPARVEPPRAEPPRAEPRPEAPKAPEPAAKAAPRPDKPPERTIVQEVPAGGPDALLAIWERVVGEVRDRKPALGAVLEHGTPKRVDREKIVVAFPQGSFFGQQAKSEESRDGLAEAAAAVVGGRPEIEVVLAAEVASETVAKLEERRRNDRNKEREREALSHPAVVAAREVFPEGEGSVKVHVDE
jgi:hypothetical protein